MRARFQEEILKNVPDLNAQSRLTWEHSARTMQMLRNKGLDSSFVFGFDWRWRPDTNYRGKSTCFTTGWKKEVKALHNSMSANVLELLPLRLVITGASCTRTNLRRHLSEKAKTLEIILHPIYGILRLDLDFQSGCYVVSSYISPTHPLDSLCIQMTKLPPVDCSTLDLISCFGYWAEKHPKTHFIMGTKTSPNIQGQEHLCRKCGCMLRRN